MLRQQCGSKRVGRETDSDWLHTMKSPIRKVFNRPTLSYQYRNHIKNELTIMDTIKQALNVTVTPTVGKHNFDNVAIKTKEIDALHERHWNHIHNVSLWPYIANQVMQTRHWVAAERVKFTIKCQQMSTYSNSSKSYVAMRKKVSHKWVINLNI